MLNSLASWGAPGANIVAAKLLKFTS